MYRATAECTVCGQVTDVGPFDNLREPVRDMLPGWLLPTDLRWSIRDGYGTPITVCETCMTRPLRDLINTVTEARGAT